MSVRAKLFLTMAAMASIVQVYPRAVRDNPPTVAEVGAPPKIRRLLRRSCYDCHSNETRWPWYSYIAPASWLVTGDVHEARLRMNFSNWPESAAPEAECYFKRRIAERARNDEMPPLRYRLLHPAAALTEVDTALLEYWAAVGCSPGH